MQADPNATLGNTASSAANFGLAVHALVQRGSTLPDALRAIADTEPSTYMEAAGAAYDIKADTVPAP